MKKHVAILFLIVFGLCFKLSAQISNDQAKVIQKCIDLPELQQYYPHETDGTMKQIYIVQYPVSFSSDLALTKAGKKILFIKSPDQFETPVESYFRYRSINIDQNSASVVLNYYFNYNPSTKQYQNLTIDMTLQKTNMEWDISKFNLKGDIR